MELTKAYVESVFSPLATSDSRSFFANVTEDVHWTVLGTHPLAGDYHSKDDFISHTFVRLGHILQDGMPLKLNHAYVDGDTAIVELSLIDNEKNGEPFFNNHCWIVHFTNGSIDEVRSYVDSALTKEAILENEVSPLGFMRDET